MTFVLNKFKVRILLKIIDHIYLWETHLNENRYEAKTLRICPFSRNSYKNQDKVQTINNANMKKPSLVNIIYSVDLSLVRYKILRHSSITSFQTFVEKGPNDNGERNGQIPQSMFPSSI